MKIVIDVFGADMPEEIVKGAITSVNLIDDVEIILTGDKDKIQKVIVIRRREPVFNIFARHIRCWYC